MTPDLTESVRRVLVENQRAAGPKKREQLQGAHGQVWGTEELLRDYVVQGFLAPFVIVERKKDGAIGTLTFQHDPRFYWGFEEDLE